MTREEKIKQLENKKDELLMDTRTRLLIRLENVVEQVKDSSINMLGIDSTLDHIAKWYSLKETELEKIIAQIRVLNEVE